MSLSVSGFFFKWPRAPAKTRPAQNREWLTIRHKSNRACQAKPGRRGKRAANTARPNLKQAQDYARTRSLINHDVQHFNICFAHALASQAGNAADGFFHIAFHNALARRKNLALHGEIVGSDGGIHCR